MDELLLCIPALILGFFLLTFMLVIWWYIEINLHQPMTNMDSYRHMYVQQAINQLPSDIVAFIWAIPALLLGALSSVISGILKNGWVLFFFFILAIPALASNEYHDTVIHNVIIIRQCILVPFAYNLLFPFLNSLRLFYNAAIILYDYYVDISKIGPWMILVKCTLNTVDLTSFFAYFANIFFAWTDDLIAWFAAGFLDNDFDIMATLDAIGLFLDCMVLPLTCLCKALGFLWEALSIFVRFPSLHMTINCLWNFIITILQIPINAIMSANPLQPDFQKPVYRGCCALKSAASTIEDTAYLIAETGWGVFSNTDLPLDVQIVLSAQWAHVLSDPLCGALILINMTLTAATHYNDLTNSAGIGYFQFGTVFDELKSAVNHLASIFALWNNDAQATIDQTLLSIVNSLAFVFEIIPGSIWYWLYGGPLPLYPSAPFVSGANFAGIFWPNYWMLPNFDNSINNSTYIYHTALNSAFTSLFMTTQALGNLIANMVGMDPLGGMVQHLLNMIISLIEILVNLIAFTYAIVTFDTDPRTTAKQVNFDNFFNEMYFFAGAVGDFWRQFAEPDPLTNFTCQISPNEDENSVWCCAGDMFEQLIDTIAVILQQVVHFLQDLLTLPTGNVMFCFTFIPFNATNVDQCVRIPDLSVALFLVDQAICSFTCAVFSVIPLISEFQCNFPPPPPPTDPRIPPQNAKPCGHVSTCTANLACSVIRILLVPFIYANTYFVQTIQGVSFNSYTDLASTGAQILFNVLAQVLEAFGLLINCTLCAFTGSGTNCPDDMYQIFAALAELVRFLPLIFTRTFFIVTKLILTFLKGLFTGDPIGAVIALAVGMLQDLFGGLGAAVVNFLVKFFDGIGLGVIGQFIKVLWLGFCPILQALLNTFILALKAITFGAVQINWVEFCCSGDPSCTPSNRKRGSHENLIDGVLHVDVESWLADVVLHYHWESDDPCNTSIAGYANENWSNLTEWQQNEVFLCFLKPYWNLRDDDQTPIGNSTCDVLMMEYNRTNWTQIEILSRRTMIDCMWSRMIVDGVRRTSGVKWIPSDLLSAPYRKYVFGAELSRGFLIYWQYTKDQSVTSETLTSSNYSESWASFGLNVSHYRGVVTTDDILIFRTRYHLKDYFLWNGNAPQYEAVQAMTSGGASFFSDFLKTLANTTKAFSDEQLDPTQYLQYSYSMDDSVAGITSSFYYLGNDLLVGGKKVYDFWANPVNIKRRSDAYGQVKAGTWEMYQAGRRELTKMGIEYWQSKRESAKKWANDCDNPVECEAFILEYNRSMHEDNHSLVYRLTHWYEKNKESLFRVYPIRHEFTGGESHHKLFQWYNPEKRVPGESYKIFPTITGNVDVNKHWMELSGQQMQHNGDFSLDPKIQWKTEKKFSNGAQPQLFSRGRPRPLEREKIYDKPPSLLNYTNKQGRLVFESGRERFWRYYEAVTKGTEFTRRRWARAGIVWNTIKERVYRNVVRNNIQFAVDHIERVYRDHTHLSTRERERMEREGEREREREILVERERESEARREIELKHQRVIHRKQDLSGLSVYRKLREQQSENCYKKEFKSDGLCQLNIPAAPPSSSGEGDEWISREEARQRIADEYDQFTNPIVRRYGGGPDPFLYLPPLPKVGTHPQGIVFSAKNGMRMMMRSEAVRQAAVSANSYLDLTCYTNISFGNSTLCDECFMLDQIVGRIESGLEWMYEYYAGGQLAASFEVGLNFYSYSFNENLTAVYGDSAQLRFGEWPGFDTNDGWYNTRPWGDNIPNKTRFSDFLGMINNATNGTNSTPPNTGGSAINNLVGRFVYAVFPFLWDALQKLIEYFSGGSGTTTVTQNAMYFIETFYLCDWLEGRDFRSLDIRFSFGEGILLFGTIYVVVSVVFLSTVSWSAFNLIALSSMGLMIVGSTFLTIVFNFAWQCLPGFPAAFADSLFYFLAYTVLPKCEWFFAFLIRNLEYDNDTCQSCDSAEGWDIIQCVDDLGFMDIFANIIFMVQFYYPSWLEWIRDTTFYPVALFYHIPIVNERINAFAGVDMSDRRTYAHYMGCNYIITLWANSIIITSILFVFYLLSPIAFAFFSLAWLFALLLYSMWRLINMICEDVYVTQTVAPGIQSGFVDGPIMEDQSLSEFTIPGRQQDFDGDGGGGMQYNARQFQSRMNRRFADIGYSSQGEKSGYSLSKIRNVISRGMDNLFLTDRKTR